MALFTRSKSQSTASGDANVPATLCSENIGGGGVSNGNGTRIVGLLTAFQASASFDIKLDGVTLETVSLASGQSRAFGVTVLRDGATGGNWTVDGETTQGSSTAFSWSGAQAFEVIGTSPEEGGAILQWYGINW